MIPARIVLFLAGALASSAIGFAATMGHGPAFVGRLEREARATMDKAGGAGVTISFATPQGWLSRHPVLRGGANLAEQARSRVAAAIATIPGVGGVQWEGLPARAASGDAPVHCQENVEAILKSRTIRFDEASAAIDPASARLLDEVAAALRPCLGGTIAITGHTDDGGDEPANVALSRARAEAVRWSLVARGIPGDGIRTAGKGSKEPLADLAPADPANRRIEFSVIERQPVRPTVVDTPGPG